MINQQIKNNRRNQIRDIIPHIVQTACAYQSKITFQVDQKRVNAKSIMGVMALASQSYDEICVSVEGEDEEEALHAMAGLLQ